MHPDFKHVLFFPYTEQLDQTVRQPLQPFGHIDIKGLPPAGNPHLVQQRRKSIYVVNMLMCEDYRVHTGIDQGPDVT